jgi:hypothetical protein
MPVQDHNRGTSFTCRQQDREVRWTNSPVPNAGPEFSTMIVREHCKRTKSTKRTEDLNGTDSIGLT